ncbi:tellurite resistance protein TehB [Legionella sainthelensi]|uniref:Tellurite resistance protein TehB n=1 Tax=Legionella sainthelensi TaxID=28087 RepID=A0A0W0YMF0_9GAMM|nr:SAM-dependent methyltransferase TehB [Legionella sainthelensi]KTD58089.1 tellurite resistance protein TehB [Legionella sainthelensi]VEH33821.1 tellurite resistance protein TehB [Legionella sainthelensi]
MKSEYSELMCYKQTEIDSHGKLKFFLEKHSTKEGTWGWLSLREGAIDFVFLNGQGQELSRTRIDKLHSQLLIPPAAWHKIIPVSEPFHANLEFYCMPQRYFNKKYGLGAAHSDLVYVYQVYLRHLQGLTILDVGCGSGRNLLYLTKMGHKVTGIDYNQSALQTIQDVVQKEVLSGVDCILHDLNHPLKLKANCFDLMIATVTLQFLEAQRVPELLGELQDVTNKNGYHFLIFPIQSDLYSLPGSFTFLPKKEELYHLYQDRGWSILEYKETVGHLHKQDEQGRPISGLFGFLFAQKR